MAQDLVTAALKVAEQRSSQPAAEPVKERLGYGAFRIRATGAFLLLTYTPKGKEADWILVAADRRAILARGVRMRDCQAAHDRMVTEGKIAPQGAPPPPPPHPPPPHPPRRQSPSSTRRSLGGDTLSPPRLRHCHPLVDSATH